MRESVKARALAEALMFAVHQGDGAVTRTAFGGSDEKERKRERETACVGWDEREREKERKGGKERPALIGFDGALA